MEHIDATAARELYPNVKGPIFGADLWSGFAILDMGKGAYGVMVAGEFVACCPDYTSAKIYGETTANVARSKMPKTVIAFALKHKIPLGASYTDDRKTVDYYYIVDDKGNRIETTRTAKPKVSHALAMCRRYLAHLGSERLLASQFAEWGSSDNNE